MVGSSISYLWNNARAAEGYQSGVSLHGHTNQSEETLDFLANFGNQYPLVRPLLNRVERRSKDNGIKIDFKRSYWTPPMTPRLAWELEGRQIEKLGVNPLVSLSDHDNIKAPMLLRTVPSARHIPVSVEWSAPFGTEQAFHLGIHNLPSETGAEWMKVFAEFTANPSDARLTEILAALHALPNVLIVMNHPIWDLYLIGQERHEHVLQRFLEQNAEFMHAFELNGLRNWEENRAVRKLALKWNKLVISGGDRHGVEPNANINLTHATSFTEFVHEVRYEGISNVLFMPQYAEPWKYRMLKSAIDILRPYPDFPIGSQTWDQRVFHPDANGVVRPISELWPSGQAPRALENIIGLVMLMGRGPVSGSLRMVWNEPHQLRFALGEREL
jgi:hypothetical protein